MTKCYFVHCDFCGKRVMVRDNITLSNLRELPQSAVPGGAPFLDPEEKKVKNKNAIPRRLMVKCPKCGRGLILRPNMVTMPEIKETEIVKKEDHSSGSETGSIG